MGTASGLEGQPDPDTELEAWARFVTTNEYVIGHLFGSILGLICLIFGVFALGVYLATSRAGRMGLWAMLLTVLGSALFLPLAGISTFAVPEDMMGQGGMVGGEWGIFGVIGMLFPLLFFGGLIALIVWAVTQLGSGGILPQGGMPQVVREEFTSSRQRRP